MQRTVIVIITLITGLIFIAGATPSFATGSTTVAFKKQNSKKLQAKKRQG
jgi:hypothetical protein